MMYSVLFIQPKLNSPPQKKLLQQTRALVLIDPVVVDYYEGESLQVVIEHATTSFQQVDYLLVDVAFQDEALLLGNFSQQVEDNRQLWMERNREAVSSIKKQLTLISSFFPSKNVLAIDEGFATFKAGVTSHYTLAANKPAFVLSEQMAIYEAVNSMANDCYQQIEKQAVTGEEKAIILNKISDYLITKYSVIAYLALQNQYQYVIVGGPNDTILSCFRENIFALKQMKLLQPLQLMIKKLPHLGNSSMTSLSHDIATSDPEIRTLLEKFVYPILENPLFSKEEKQDWIQKIENMVYNHGMELEKQQRTTALNSFQ